MVVNREQTRRRGISEEIYRNNLINIHGISVCTVLCEETEALDSLQNNTHFSMFSEICCFFLVKHTQNILVAKQNACSVGKLQHSQFPSAFVDFHQLCVETFQFSKFQILERRKCPPIMFSGVEVNKHVSGCEQTLT